MKNKWITRLIESNKELLLIFSIILFAALINFFVAGQRLVLTFYNLPPCLPPTISADVARCKLHWGPFWSWPA